MQPFRLLDCFGFVAVPVPDPSILEAGVEARLAGGVWSCSCAVLVLLSVWVPVRSWRLRIADAGLGEFIGEVKNAEMGGKIIASSSVQASWDPTGDWILSCVLHGSARTMGLSPKSHNDCEVYGEGGLDSLAMGTGRVE
jgi:hypothetical protein